jgi:hypothetical protein
MIQAMFRWRKKESPQQRAAEIIAKDRLRRKQRGALFTPLQSQKMRELGLTQSVDLDTPENSHKLETCDSSTNQSDQQSDAQEVTTRDPLTVRQRALLEQLGLSAPQDLNKKD